MRQEISWALPAWLLALLPLAGVIIGGLLGIWGTSRAENVRWKRARLEKLAEQERLALAGALEWIEPLRIAYIKVSSLLLAAHRGDVDEEHVRERWPRLLTTMTAMDLPADQLAVLRKGVYAEGLGIIRRVERLEYEALKMAQRHRASMRMNVEFDELGAWIDELEQKINELEEGLQEDYRATFA